MPYRKRYTRKVSRSSKRKYKRKRYKSWSLMRKQPKAPLGKRFLFKTRYFDTAFLLDPGAGGTVASHVFSANGMYDPDVTGTGHQPIGFDEIMGNMYDHYTVIGSKIRVWFSNNDATQNQLVGIYVKDTATTQADPRVIVENGLGKYAYLGEHNGSGSDESKQLQLGHSVKKFFSKNPLAEAQLQGTSTSNPTEQSYFHVWACSTNGADTAACRLCVEIEYIAVLTEPKQLSLS